jgi:hypothetical protein
MAEDEFSLTATSEPQNLVKWRYYCWIYKQILRVLEDREVEWPNNFHIQFIAFISSSINLQVCIKQCYWGRFQRPKFDLSDQGPPRRYQVRRGTA